MSHIPSDITRSFCNLTCKQLLHESATIHEGKQEHRRAAQMHVHDGCSNELACTGRLAQATSGQAASAHTFLAAKAAPIVFLGWPSKIPLMYLSSKQDLPVTVTVGDQQQSVREHIAKQHLEVQDVPTLCCPSRTTLTSTRAIRARYNTHVQVIPGCQRRI